MLIVTGATGHLGWRIVEKLLQRVPAEQVGVSVRSPEKAGALVARGVRVGFGDFDDPASLRRSWAGAQRLLLVSSNVAAVGGDAVEQHARAIAIAKEVGVERIFYTSQIASSPNSLFPPARDHAATEALLAASGIAWTAMRHGFYAQSALAMQAEGLKNGVIAAPADGPVAWTTHDDLAEADAALLAGERTIDGPTPPLTGSATSDLADIAAIASSKREASVSRKFISLGDLASNARANGIPEGAVEIMLGYYRAAQAGEFANVDPTLASILGRQPTTMADFIASQMADR